ncbi:enoyl-CoA hydratase/isomerase family protein [Vibrio sp. JPW-9-11-11]|uniref:enoyl-CoA hydratase/isomerase family protein n=1 Tax=Vibrio sp. JPW-9-11-11 TaxID=1416532 RepID=UPI0015943842|nr:enoyl-CoA hydratase/isomerase family protein [Vibrio sp. JPW-9-11-11]NVD08051.1 enoyl-CoA hydratase/isomerase family protein [Vibrio sp. JPW-9-11-11]
MSDNVHFTELPCSDGVHKIAVATLDNPASLNALTLDMLTDLKQQLVLWHDDESIVCVVLEGAGEKAFCAGGDVRTMHQWMQSGPAEQTQERCSHFFTIEYQCDYLIHTYCKPIIAWGQGIVMGGGMGLYMGASHKVVTPDSRLAMPEVSIGLYPDVGGTWFLNRLDSGVGMFLGLTGVMVNATDAVAIHLADHLVMPQHRQQLTEQLQIADWECVDDVYEVVTELLEGFALQVNHQPQAQMVPYLGQIRLACSADNVIQVLDNIQAIQGDSKWLDVAKANSKLGSPITAHLCFRQMTQYRDLSLADCFRLELNISVRSALLGEFQEGVRARLVDKDGQPRWRYPNVAAVEPEVIDELCRSLWPLDAHPLAQLGHY